MIELMLHGAVLVVVLLCLLVGGCGAVPSQSSSRASTNAKLTVHRVYDSPNGPDLYRIKGPHGTTYQRVAELRPLEYGVADCKR